MKQSTPEHGQRACYLRGCRLPECEADNYRYMSRLRLEYHHGDRRRVDANPAAQHVKQLLAASWTQGQIARAAGIARRTIGALVIGAHATISRDTERRLLSVPFQPPVEPSRDVDATGTTRRIRALIAMGHTGTAIASRIGMHRDALNRIARGEMASVRRSTAEQAAAVYRLLSRQPGTSVRARSLAVANGWDGPLAWDEQTIGDPTALPEPDSSEAKEPGALKRLDVEHLLRFGVSADQVVQRTGASLNYVREIAAEIRNGKPRDRSRNKTTTHSVKEAA